MPKRDRKHRNGQGKVSAKLKKWFKKWFNEGSKEISLFMLVPSDSELNQVRSFLNKDLKIRLNSANQWFFVISFPAFDAEVAPILPYYTHFTFCQYLYERRRQPEQQLIGIFSSKHQWKRSTTPMVQSVHWRIILVFNRHFRTRCTFLLSILSFEHTPN